MNDSSGYTVDLAVDGAFILLHDGRTVGSGVLQDDGWWRCVDVRGRRRIIFPDRDTDDPRTGVAERLTR